MLEMKMNKVRNKERKDKEWDWTKSKLIKENEEKESIE